MATVAGIEPTPFDLRLVLAHGSRRTGLALSGLASDYRISSIVGRTEVRIVGEITSAHESATVDLATATNKDDVAMALAVLRGDKTAALMLADKVLETYHASTQEG